MVVLFALPLVVSLFAALVLSVATPARYQLLYGFCLAMLVVIWWAFPAGPEHSSPFAGGDRAILVWLVICCVAGMAARVFTECIYRVVMRLPLTRDAIFWPDQPADGALAVTGSMAGLCIAAVVTETAQNLRAGRTAFLIVAAGIISVCVFSQLGSAVLGGLRSPAVILRSLRRAALIVLAIVTVVSLATIPLVYTRAEAAAGGTPYCVAVALPHDPTERYGEAASLLDLSPLTMRGHCREGWCWQYHAILAIGATSPLFLLNWSYKYREFRADAKAAGPVICDPKPHFVKDLPIF